MSTMFTYDQTQAANADAGGGDYLTTSAVVRGFIKQALWTQAPSSQSQFLELSMETEQGQEVNYLSICYRNKAGDPVKFGEERIHSIMGCTGTQQLSANQGPNGNICPELVNKPIALALERHNYRNGSGKDKFRFEIKAVMSAKSWLTINEHQNNKGPESKAYWEKRFAEQPGGVNAAGMSQAAPNYDAPPIDAYDDMPAF